MGHAYGITAVRNINLGDTSLLSIFKYVYYKMYVVYAIIDMLDLGLVIN